ncbi:unnamed protein product [Phytomonas sp. EM1]|nr:unnamed protein product [Phytomonas sp. EM1]|eukprot:CCW64298.1 unnamed protein product [Phytomonas sp. isolate EM1]
MHSKSKNNRLSSQLSARPQVAQESELITQGAALPPPDPAAVQKLIDEAIARARVNRPTRTTENVDPWHLTPTTMGSTNKFTILKRLIVVFLLTFITTYLIITGYWGYRHLTVFK